jgi:hypothetical protein
MTLAPRMKHHGLNEEKNLIGKKQPSIELSEVYVWLVWILTTISVSLLVRVENKLEEGNS